MTDLRKAAEMALEALEDSMYPQKKQFDAIVGLKQALNVDAIDTSSTYVDKNEKREHEPTPYLANGTRFKVSGLHDSGAIMGLPIDLIGEWVALVDATDDKHLQVATPSTKEPWDTSDMAYRPNGLSVEQEPYGYVYEINGAHTEFSKELPPDDAYDEGTLVPVFTAPPSKPWVSLSDDEAYQLLVDYCDDDLGLLNAIEAALKERNN